ncbi:MAG: putative lipid flippase FtsW, partial [Rhodoferax sp.]|nr:putative lipid flippase FtsW [Rhodoferax sp.]
MSGISMRWTGWFKGLPQAAADALPVRLGASGFSRTPSRPVHVKGFDQPLLWVTVALLAWGLVMVYSASIAMPDNPRFANYGHNFFLIRHAAFLGVAFVASLIAIQVP